MGEIGHFCARQSRCQGTMGCQASCHFVMMIYNLDSRRTFQGDLALCSLYAFLRLNVTDIHEGISAKISGTVSTSAFLLDMTVMSSSGVIVSP